MTAARENGQGTCLFGESSIAYQRVEALFDLLRRPATAVEAPSADVLIPGSVLSEFTILRPLASGGMGHVYLARQESLGRLVALKVCKPEMARDARIKSRFQTEALSLAQLAHPNVVPVVSTGEDQGCLYLAMEYIAGPTLAQVLEAMRAVPADTLASTVVARVLADPQGDSQSRPWSAGRARLDRAYQTWAVQTLQQVAQGLAAAHAAGILHRDIKPSNIVFAANGVPKIVDFGLARTALAPSTTAAGEFYGTPAYTSPEQARGDPETVSPASDVFSFGVTLYECLSLERPFPGRNSADVLSAVLNSDAPLLRNVEKRIPWELEAITDKCLRKTPAERYPSGQPLADDLRNYLELRPVVARSPSMIGRVGRMIRRRPWVAAFLCTLVTAAVFGGFLAKRAWADYQAEKVRTFEKRVDEGDVALFRCLTGQRPTWLPAVTEQQRQHGIAAYTAALETNPDAVRPLVQRARLYASKKETLDLALADLGRAQQLQPSYGSIRKFRGFVLDQLGRTDEGRAAKDEAKKLYPIAADDLYWLGVFAHSKEQDFFGSYDFFSRALLIAPGEYWSRLERAYYGRMPSEGFAAGKRVIPELEIAKTIRPDLPFASEFLAKFCSTERLNGLDVSCQKKELTELNDRFGLDILRAYDMARLLQKEKRYDEAEVILRSVLDQDPGGHTAEEIGGLKYRCGQFEQACVWYRRAISEGDRNPITYSQLANACIAMNDWNAAEQALLDGIAENPKHAFLYGDLGCFYEKRGRFADAETQFRKGCELPCDFPDYAPAVVAGMAGYSQQSDVAWCYRELAALLKRLGRQAEQIQVLQRGIAQIDKAIATPRQALRESVESHASQLNGDLCQAYLEAGRRRDAVAMIDAEWKKKPMRAANVFRVVNILQILGDDQAALAAARLAEFTALLDMRSEDRQLARSTVDGQLQRMGLLKELLDRLETRRALGEELGVIEYSWLGMNLYQGAEAVTILGEGVKKYPDSEFLQSNYMQVLAKAGRKEEARQAYERSRDLYFAHVNRSVIPEMLLPAQPIEVPPLPPMSVALSWYKYLLDEGKDDDLGRLDARLRDLSPKTGTDAKALLLPRAFAEFGARRFAAAAKSLETCLQERVWNEAVSEAMITGALAKSHRALGRRQDAIKWYRREVQLSCSDARLLSEFFCLVVEDGGVDGLARELAAFDNPRLALDVRRNATMYCFSAWAALAKGDEAAATENLIIADTYLPLASLQPQFVAADSEALACVTIAQLVSDKLADSKRSARAAEFLKRYPAERVNAMRELFSLPTTK